MVVFYTFLGLVLIRLIFTGLFLWLLVPVGPACPACGGETIRIRVRDAAPLLSWVERRWCLRCGWGGLTRRSRRSAVVPQQSIPVP